MKMICKCGHIKSLHKQLYGACCAEGCSCKKFELERTEGRQRMRCWISTYETLQEAARDMLRNKTEPTLISDWLSWREAFKILYSLVIDGRYQKLTEKTLINLKVQSKTPLDTEVAGCKPERRVLT